MELLDLAKEEKKHYKEGEDATYSLSIKNHLSIHTGAT